MRFGFNDLLTNIYIDGFNLYFRALRGTPFKWLDLRRFGQVLFPDDEINRVSYFTARIKARPRNPNQPQRQQVYLRALATLPNVEIHYGTYRDRTKTRPLADPIPGMPNFVKVLDSEEKGSDVNLATRLLVDGFEQDFEQAVIVSNDSDLASPIKYVRDQLQLEAVVVNPDGNNVTHKDLVGSASYTKRLRPRHLRSSQLPPTLDDQHGTISKPPSW